MVGNQLYLINNIFCFLILIYNIMGNGIIMRKDITNLKNFTI